MPKLVIEQPGVAPVTADMTGLTLHLGRAEDNDVILVADEVSRHHVKLVHRGENVILVDLNSMNGTYVNRQRIIERVLSDKDDIWLGSKCHLIYHADPVSAPGDPAPVRPSSVVQDLDQIREEMENVGNSMTLIGAQATLIQGGAPTTPPPEELMKMGRAYRRLSALYEASRLIFSEFDLNKRLESVLDIAMQALNAERGFVLIRQEGTDDLTVSVAREMGHGLGASSPSMGIARRAAIDGEPVLMTSGDQEDQFAGRASIIQQRIANAMCVPLRVEQRILGSIYVDTREATSTFTNEDLELFASLAAQSAMAIDNVQLYEQKVEAEKERANLGRFLSPAIIDEIMREDTALELGGRKRTVTSMFCDIRGFTPIAERISPAELVALLNEHFTAMTSIIFGLEGTLDKYIGDEIMAVFGAPLSAPDDAERAVRAALAMQAKNEELNALRTQTNRPQFEVGIGINTGEVIAGYIGSPDRMEFTVVGDPVNVARRLCSLAAPGQTVIGELTHGLVSGLVETRPTGSVMLKGKSTSSHAFTVEGLK